MLVADPFRYLASLYSYPSCRVTSPYYASELLKHIIVKFVALKVLHAKYEMLVFASA